MSVRSPSSGIRPSMFGCGQSVPHSTRSGAASISAAAKGTTSANGVPAADASPAELAPTTQQSLQWPKWGQYFETQGAAGEKPDMPHAVELFELNNAWLTATDRARREEIWHKMLSIHADQVFTIGLVSGVQQPVIVRNDLRNVPAEGIYNWDPGAHFGIYRPDTFWFDR